MYLVDYLYLMEEVSFFRENFMDVTNDYDAHHMKMVRVRDI